MYVSIRDAIVPWAGYSTLVEGLQALEVDAVEVAVGRDFRVLRPAPVGGEPHLDLGTLAGVDAFQKEYESAGIRLAGFLLANNFNADDLPGELDWVVRVVQLAEELQVGAVRIDSAMRGEREMPLEARIQRVVECLKHIFDATAGGTVPLGIENHGFQGNDPAFLDPIFAEVGSDRLGLTLDTGNFYWRGHPLSRVYQLIEHFAPRVKHTHVKNICYPSETREQEREIGWKYGEYVCPIPDGDIDHRRVVQILQDAGYTGDFCCEDESLGRYGIDERKATLRRDINYMKTLV